MNWRSAWRALWAEPRRPTTRATLQERLSNNVDGMLACLVESGHPLACIYCGKPLTKLVLWSGTMAQVALGESSSSAGIAGLAFGLGCLDDLGLPIHGDRENWEAVAERARLAAEACP
jgi:hypothetical protein